MREFPDDGMPPVGAGPCGALDQFRGLLDDTLAEDEERHLLDHLGSCAACQAEVEHLAADGAWWDNLRRFAPRDPGESGETGSAPGRSFRTGEDVSLRFLAPSDDPRFIGRLGRYEVTGLVGQGGMGLVLKAFDPPLNRYVAIKVLAPELATSGSSRRRFAREAKAAAAVVHDHVIPIYAVGEAGGLPYLVMPYVAGGSLRERIAREGPLGLEETLRVGMQAARGLAAAHEQGLVHRDVKPANILMEEGIERAKLVDFGLARAAEDASVTQSGVVTGTPEYMSPEQARGEQVDHRSDLFSLGGVLYAMLVGHAPFRAGSTLAVLRRVCDDRHRPIRAAQPGVPGWLEEVVDRLLEKDPAARFASAEEVADLLGRHLARVQNPTLPAVVHPWVKPRPGKKPRLLVAAASLLIGAAIVWGRLAMMATQDDRGLPGVPFAAGNEGAPATPREPDADRLRAAFHQDFRKSQFDPKTLKLAGWNVERLFRPTAEGLRLTIPGKAGKFYWVGIAPRFRVRGDFEVTYAYEILKADPSREGFGLGAALTVKLDSPGKEELVVENSDAPPKPTDPPDRAPRFFNATHITGPPDGRKYSPRNVPSRVKAGRLRITRVGPTACAWYSEGDAPYVLLRQLDLGDAEVAEVEVGANLGGSTHALDLLIRDLSIRAEELPGFAGAPPSSSSSPWKAVAAIAGAIALAGALIWWVAASRRRAGTIGEKAAPSPTPAKAAAKPKPAATWDEEVLGLLEAEARAHAEEHPDAGKFSARPRAEFQLKDGELHGPFVAWHPVDPAELKRWGTNWGEVRKRLPTRFQGEYRDGKRHGIFVCLGASGESEERAYRAGERVG